VGVRIIWDPGETPCDWAVTRSSLISRLTLVTYWLEGACNAPGGHGMHKPDDIHWFPVSVPDFVDWAELAGDVVTCDEMGRAGSGRSTSMWSEVFLVLDRPKPPMDPAWVTFLRYTCKWARYRPGPNNVSLWDARTRTFDEATQRVTFGFFYQRPGVAYTLRTTWVDPRTRIFYLKELLDYWNGGTWVGGNCWDVACLNLMAMCSIGIDFMYRQLTGDGEDGVFWTHPICPIGSDPLRDDTYVIYGWAWHAISTVNGEQFNAEARVWDPTAAQKLDLEGASYRNPPAHYPPGGTSGPSKGIGTLRVDLDSLPVLGRGPTLLTNCIHWRMENAVLAPYGGLGEERTMSTKDWIPPDWRKP
jgi:hypothetical protein